MSERNEYPSLGTPPSGSIRFNTDSSKMEIYNGDKWWEIDSTSPEEQTGGTRGVFAGGGFPTSAVIDYVNITTTGNAISFGSLSRGMYLLQGTASRSRGLFHGLHQSGDPVRNDDIEFITISTTGDTSTFGNLSTNASGNGACGNGVRGIFNLSYIAPANRNILEYVTIASTGDSKDFGDLTVVRRNQKGGVNSPVRGVWAGGQTPSTTDVIVYITISTLGDSLDFGNLTTASREGTGCSNCIRGFFLSGSGGTDNQIEYITIATLGNASDFGDLTYDAELAAGAASPTRAIFGGGTDSGAKNINDYWQIMTTWNSVYFGDRTISKYGAGGISNVHGGLV